MLPDDLHVLARGWLHGNVLWTESGEVVDTGYHTGVDAVLAALGGRPVHRILLTHVHADHAGGVAALVAATGASVHAHPAAAALTDPWDAPGMWLGPTGQELPRFSVDHQLGDHVELAGRTWTVLETAGHATGGVSFLDPRDGVLITGDALWEDGLGVLDPWVDGEGVFSAAHTALDRLAATDAVVVVPGHGAPFTDLAGAVARARSRLVRWESDRAALRRHVLRVGLAFWDLLHPDADDETRAQRQAAMAAAHPPTAGLAEPTG